VLGVVGSHKAFAIERLAIGSDMWASLCLQGYGKV